MIEGKKLVIEKNNLNNIIKIMLLKNYDYIPIFYENTIKGILTKNEILNLYYEGLIKKTTKVSSLDEKKYLTINKDAVKFVKEDKPLELILVTNTGNSKGKLLGLITEFDVFNYTIE